MTHYNSVKLLFLIYINLKSALHLKVNGLLINSPLIFFCIFYEIFDVIIYKKINS